MKCFYHPAADAVATCSTCSKAACHECIWDTGGSMTCSSCYNMAVDDHNKVAKKAMWRMVWSVVFIIFVGGMFSGIFAQSKLNGFLAFLLGYYCAFSLFWGVPTMWGWWSGFFRKMGCILFLTPIGWLFFFYLPVVFGFFYGLYGGAIYQFFKTLKVARSKAQRIQ